MDESLYKLSDTQCVVPLECTDTFNSLTDKEKLYAHHLSKAIWNGGLIVLFQTSEESPLIFALLYEIYSKESIEELKNAAKQANVTEKEFAAFLVYSCGIFTNAGNYTGVGGTKIIPDLSEEKFKTIIKASRAYQINPDKIKFLLNNIWYAVYLLNEKSKSFGFNENETNNYFSANCTVKDKNEINAFLEHEKIKPHNIRCFKIVDNSNEEISTTLYKIRLASVNLNDAYITQSYEQSNYKIIQGDFSQLLKIVVSELELAKKYVPSEIEEDILSKYMSHFKDGSVEHHKDGSRLWVKYRPSSIESYMGFIETYRNAAVEQREFEGFVAVVNKQKSKILTNIVDNIEQFIDDLPWSHQYENKYYYISNFCYLDVLTFAGSSVPTGLNMPSYHDIREKEGCKNIWFRNVTPAYYDHEIPFLSNENQHLLRTHRKDVFEMQSVLHEFFGHACGKLFKQDEKNRYNFEYDVEHLLTNERIGRKNCYRREQTYYSQFKDLAATFEECRAEACGLLMCCNRKLLEKFGFNDIDMDDIINANWLSVLWSGLAESLHMYDPTTKKWTDPKAQARYVLLRFFVETQPGFIYITATDNETNLELTIKYELLYLYGKCSLINFLRELQAYRSIADVESAKKFYTKYSDVPEDGQWARWRSIVLSYPKKPRKMFVQPNTILNKSEVTLKTYESSFEGIIQSWIERFSDIEVSDILLNLWEEYYYLHETGAVISSSEGE